MQIVCPVKGAARVRGVLEMKWTKKHRIAVQQGQARVKERLGYIAKPAAVAPDVNMIA